MYKKKDESKDELQDKFVEIIKETVVHEQESTRVINDLVDTVDSLQTIVDDKLKRKNGNDHMDTNGG
jgi:hypothetical protein